MKKLIKDFLLRKKDFQNIRKEGSGIVYYPQYTDRPENGMIVIPKVGKIKLIYHRPIPNEAEIKTLTLIQEGNKWFVCFSVELPDRPEPMPKQTKVIGIDLGLNSFMYSSDGEAVKAPRYMIKCAKNFDVCIKSSLA